MNSYKEWKKRTEQAYNEVLSKYAFFAYSQKQFKEGMEKLGLTENDTDKICRFIAGGYCKKSDIDKIHDVSERTHKQKQELINADKTGEGFIKEMFKYEMWNHEYLYSLDDEEILDACDISKEDFMNNPALGKGWELAKQEYRKEYYED